MFVEKSVKKEGREEHEQYLRLAIKVKTERT